MANTIITATATIKAAMTTVTITPITIPITHPDTRKVAAALSSTGDVGAEES